MLKTIISDGEKKNRISWVDIYKCLAIILVVVGHATGKFNGYIYQFHMAAFFFISGYTSDLRKKRISNTIWMKFFQLYLPIISITVISLSCMNILRNNGFEGILYPEGYYPGFKMAIKLFIERGDVYAPWLGACWFIITLFWVTIVQKLVLRIAGNRYNAGYVIMTFALYGLGYILLNTSPFDLIFIAQFYFGIGTICNNIMGKYISGNENKRRFLLPIPVAILNISIMHILLQIGGCTVDWPSRTFSNPIKNALIAFNGILLLLMISVLADFLIRNLFVVRKLLTYIGKNTFGIVVFHFAFFKVCFVIMYKLNILDVADLAQNVPPTDIGNVYWPILTVVGMGGSLAVWTVISKIPILNIFFGMKKEEYLSWYNKLLINTYMVKLLSIYKYVCAKIKNWAKLIEKSSIWFVCVFALIIAVCIPLYRAGIIINDELQARFWGMQGFVQLYKHYFVELIFKGRILQVFIVPISLYLGFLSSNIWVFKIIQLFSILLIVILWGCLIYRIFGNRKLASIVSTLQLIWIPISFEHTEPNAFLTLYDFPYCLLIVSVILWIFYLEHSDRKKVLVASMILLFISECSYEGFVTFVVPFILIGVYKLGFNRILKDIKTYLYPVAVTIVYLVLYVVCGKLFPSNYSGNQIGISSIGESLHIIMQLLAVTIPGFYRIDAKYRDLYNYYKIIHPINQFSAVIIGIVLLTSSIILYNAFKKSQNSSKRLTSGVLLKDVGVVIGVMFSCACIMVPISVASMYQGIVGDNGFLGLPVTWFGYFLTVTAIGYVIWRILQHTSNKLISAVIVAVICVMTCTIQTENHIFADEQSENYERLVYMEDFCSSGMLDVFNNEELYVADFYTQKNLLYIHDGYWTSYIQTLGYNIPMLNEAASLEQNRVYLDDNTGVFMAWNGDKLCIMSEKPVSGAICVEVTDGEYLTVTPECAQDGDWFKAYYRYVDGQLVQISLDEFNLVAD